MAFSRELTSGAKRELICEFACGSKTMASAYPEKIKNAFQPLIDALQWIWEKIQAVSDAVSDIPVIGDVAGGVTGGLKKVGSFLGFAEGGIVSRPTAAMVGEAGPEAIIPLKHGSVPVEFMGTGGGGEINTNDTYNISVNVQSITEQSDIRSGVDNLMAEIKRRKKLGE